MARLLKFWFERHKMLRTGIVLALIFYIAHVVFWYVNQYVGFGSSFLAANAVNYIHVVVYCFIAVGVIIALLGIVAEINERRQDN